MPKTRIFSLFLLVSGCQQPTSQAPPTKTLAPVPKPVSAPVSAPASLPVVPASLSQPTSAPSPESTSAPVSAPSAASLPDDEFVSNGVYYVEGAYPNPKIEAQLSCESSFKAEECEVKLQTTMLYSCLCSSMQWNEAAMHDRGANPTFTADATNYLIEGDTVRRLSFDDLFQASAKKQITKLPDNFAITKNDEDEVQVEFYDNFPMDPQIFKGDELKRILLSPTGPLSMLEGTTALPQSFEDLTEMQKTITPQAFTEKTPPTSMPVEGKLLQGLRWTDKNGENIALFSAQKSTSKDKLKSTTYLYVNHYLKQEDVITKLRNIADKEEKCESPINLAEFIDGTIRVTDIDRDGVGELSFVYQLGCVDEPTEAHFVKAFLLENGEKFALRGDSWANSTPRADKALEKAPGIFTDYLGWLFKQSQ